jgi:peptidoglycan hydrolase-like protein with peptidoglycan-binding domain
MGAAGPSSIAIQPTAFDDSRTVKLKVATSDKHPLNVPTSGVITAIDCVPGQGWSAGSTPLSINEAPKLAIFAQNPLWRDLSGGEKGADAAAIQRILADDGYDSPSTGQFDLATRAAWQRLLQANRIPSPYGAFLLSDVILLPSEQVTLGACPARRGEAVVAGEAIAEIQSALASVSLDSSPLVLTPGQRTLTIGGSTVPVGEDAAVTERAALAQLATEPAIIAKVTTPVVELSGVYRLATPLTVFRVPPSVLVEVQDTAACLVGGDEKGYPVTIVSSSLGSTAVAFAAEVTPPDKAALEPEASISCG